MLKPATSNRFEKDVKKAQKRSKNIKKLKNIMELLANEVVLPAKNRNHKLQGQYNDHWECHIEPDWLLIYQKTDTEIIFVRTGTHADLF